LLLLGTGKRKLQVWWLLLCRGGQPWATASSLLELGAGPTRGEQGREKLACALDSRGSGLRA
jgi:hypothetical protein